MACVESPLGTGTKSCRPYPVPTFSISSGCSSSLYSRFLIADKYTAGVEKRFSLHVYRLKAKAKAALLCFIPIGVSRQMEQKVALNVSSPP